MAVAASRSIRKRILSNKLSVIGITLSAMLVIAGIFAPWLSPYDPQEMMFEHVFQPPSIKFYLGTDALGRCVFSRIVWGARTSLFVGIGATLVALFIGVLFGSLAGYYGKTVSQIFMRLADIQLSIPRLILLIVAAAVLGERSIGIIIIIIGITLWPSLGRVTRSKVLDLKTRDFVEAARAGGISDLRILWKHILPNGMGPITVVATLDIGQAIISEASLSFLGLSDPQTVSWGDMITKAMEDMMIAPWVAIFPGLAIFLAVWGLNMFGDALRDALDVES
jgi:ABC-type dipeptide/oligopeptide/nickel transport system permease subunit